MHLIDIITIQIGTQLLRGIDDISYDENLKIKKQTCIEFGLNADKSPLVEIPTELIPNSKGNILVVPNDLPNKARKLYDLIHKVSIAEWFADAIDLSLANKKCALYKKLQDKLLKNTFKNDKQLYLRIPIGNKNLNLNMMFAMLKLHLI